MNKDVVNININIKNNQNKENEKIKINQEINQKIYIAYKGDKTNIPPLILNHKYINDSKINNHDNKIMESNKSIFSNMEIKKHINNEDSKYNRNYNIHSAKKMNIKNIIIPEDNKKKELNFNMSLKKNINNIINNNKAFFSEKKKKKELKEQSTNTSNYNNLYLNDNYDNENLCLLNSKDSFREEKNYNLLNKKCMKTSNNLYSNLYIIENPNLFNKNNKNCFSQSNMLITNINKNTPKNNFSKLNNIRDVIIDNNNIKSYEEINKNNYKYYADIYNYNMAQTPIQNKGNFFSMKNITFFPFQILNSNNNRNILNNNNELNINSFYYNNNNFSIRELYRNLNSENYSSYSHLINKNKKNKKKNIKKSYELKINKNNNNNSKRKFNLTNLQYEFKQDKDINIYNNLFLTKRYTNLNFYKNLKKDTKNKYPYYKRKKIIGNYFENVLNKKNKNNNNINDDILEIGLINSSSQTKINKKNSLNYLIGNKNKNIEIVKINKI